MGSKAMRDTKMVSRRARKRLVAAISRKRICSSRTSIHYFNDDDRSPNFAAASVSDKLEALKKLIPLPAVVVNNNDNDDDDDDIKATDQLFKQTADYILLLKTQVSILQGLVDFYEDGSQNI